MRKPKKTNRQKTKKQNNANNSLSPLEDIFLFLIARLGESAFADDIKDALPIPISEGTFYNTIRKLSDAKLVTYSTAPARGSWGGGRPRRRYECTEEGERYLRKA